MKKIYLPLAILILNCLCSPTTRAQVAFKNANIRLNATGHSGCPMAVTDWNGDGMDDIVRLDLAKDVIVEIQRTNNTFETRSLGSFNANSGWAWAMCVADVDHNGYKDIIAGGNSGGVKIMMINSTGLSGTILTLPNSTFFLQNLTFGDFNNDGWIDIFCCDDNDQSHIYLNDGTGNLIPSTIINFDVTTTDDSGNYGSVWTDFDNDGDLDLYIAKCRQGVTSPTDGRRINVMFVNDGNNNYTEMAGVYGINIGWQSWTASFGDLDNDADLDLLVTNHDHESQILQNDGTGHYTDITSLTGFDITDITPIESVIEDFDNDGWQDILATGSDSRFYKNMGNGTFSRIEGLFDTNEMESFAIGDLNHDGFIDIYGGYADIYTSPTNIDDVIWLNKPNANHFFTLNLKGTTSNHDAIGARARIYGSWGVQLREVRSGDSYGTVNSPMLHFGLGQATVIDSVVISWPGGTSQTIYNPSIDQFLTVSENDCVSPEAIVTYSGSLILCTGQTLSLLAPAGFDYLWSDGSTGQSILVTAPGDYNVRISIAGNNCWAVSKTLEVVYNPDETPVINVSGELEFCNGGSVLLESAPGMLGYLWSNGDTNQNVTIVQSGTYTLTIQGHCQAWSSAPVTVTVHTVADPVSSDVTITTGSTATLNATGTNLTWFDLPAGGTPVSTGSSYTTPALFDTTVYYVEAADLFGGGIFPGGKPIHTGNSQYSTSNSTNALTFFDILEPCTIKTVKVYTDMAGYRSIELRDNTGNLLDSLYANILPDSQVVTLNWFLNPGSDYTIGTSALVNQAIPGWGELGPRLKRNNGDVTYPYDINGLATITGSSLGNSLYYYFYDWQVEATADSCFSNRIPVTVNVNGTTGISGDPAHSLQIYPNPGTEKINIKAPCLLNARLSISDETGRIVMQDVIQGTTKNLDVSTLARGIYILKAETDEQKWINKLVIR